MNDDALKKLWQEQSLSSTPALPDEKQIAAMRNRMKDFDKTIGRRDYGEVAACVFIIAVFGWDLLFGKNSLLTQTGCAVLIGSALFIWWKLIASKRRLPKAEPNAPVLETVKVELKKVENQIGLLKSVAWWYLLPLLIGVELYDFGVPGSLRSKIIHLAVMLVVYAVIYWLNQYAAKHSLLPLKRELESLLHSVETGGSLDETHVASLRPIAPSMAAADQVKPAEFKVAFWQIALFGEIGFVGIWFFLMLGRTKGNFPRIFIPEHLVWVVPFFLGGLLYSWLLQKITKRAVGISLLGIHLNKGQKLILWDEIKDVRPFRFLHIRNLWLIRESGEKTLMHWTPLERHSDLKAAVESLTPANHPIRKYLALLQHESPKKNLMTKLMLIGIAVALIGTIGYLSGKDDDEPNLDIQKIVDEAVQEQHSPGLVVGVIDAQGSKIYAAGKITSSASKKADGDTLFEIGSITKVFTALLLQEMADRSELKLDDPVEKFLPGSVKIPARNGKKITLRHLATHRSGLPRLPDNLVPKDDANPYADYTVGMLYEFLSRHKLSHDPGEKYDYSNLGTGLLGLALSLQGGADLEDLFAKRIFEPLKMNDTPRHRANQSTNAATGHDASGKPVKHWDFQAPVAGAGAVRSSAHDLLKFLAANLALTESPLSPALSQIQVRQEKGGWIAPDMALGWHLQMEYQKKKYRWFLWHNGGTGGFRSFIALDKTGRRGVVVLGNSENSVDDIGLRLIKHQLFHDQPPPEFPVAKVNPKLYDAYVGTYRFDEKSSLTVTRQENRLLAQITSQAAVEVYPKADTEFFYKVVNAQLTFEKDRSGVVTSVILHQNGLDQRVIRIK